MNAVPMCQNRPSFRSPRRSLSRSSELNSRSHAGGAARRGDSPDSQPFPDEVPRPCVAPRIEDAHHPVRVGVHAGQVGAFPFVAPGASPRKIVQRIRTTVTTGADVLQLAEIEWRVHLSAAW